MTELIFRDTDYRYGFHWPMFSTFEQTVRSCPYPTLQIYLPTNSNHCVEFDISDVLNTRKILQERDNDLYIHGSLFYNLCGTVNHRRDPKFLSALERTCNGLVGELDIAVGLGAEGVVVHPNSCRDVEKGLFTASKTIEHVLTRNTKLSLQLSRKLGISQEEFKRRRTVILENSAQEGNKRGGTLEELATMIHGVNEKIRNQVGVCIDTAHSFGAGLYDWGIPSEVHRFYHDFDRIIGLDRLHVFHLNDSKASKNKGSNAYFGSKKDRHENLGMGWIFSDEIAGTNNGESRLKGLKTFFIEAREKKIKVIGEPPGGQMLDWDMVCKILLDDEYPLEETYLI